MATNMEKIKKSLTSVWNKITVFLAKPFRPDWKRILIFVAIPVIMSIIADYYSGCQCKIPWAINALGNVIVGPFFILDFFIWISGARPPVFASETGYFINDVFLLSMVVWWYVLSGLIIFGLNKLNLKKIFNNNKVSRDDE
jgi:hypothetical protein